LVLLSVIFSYRIIKKVAQDIEQNQRYQRYQIKIPKIPNIEIKISSFMEANDKKAF
jgi:hypothetical protein